MRLKSLDRLKEEYGFIESVSGRSLHINGYSLPILNTMYHLFGKEVTVKYSFIADGIDLGYVHIKEQNCLLHKDWFEDEHDEIDKLFKEAL